MTRLKLAVLATAVCSMSAATASDLSYLQGLLDATPGGGWVKASTNRFSDAWPTGADLPPPTPSGPQAVAYAWSGFAWDSVRGNLLLFGGGHANYVGNEVYVWQGANGEWTRGTLPSKVDLSSHLVVGNGAPQSSHTYQTNSYVPINDRFVVFGGASWNSGGNLADADGRTGPWWWDPSRADPDKVGGADGTGWNAAREGADSWQARPYSPWVGYDRLLGPNHVYGTTAYRSEGGKDVIYLTMDQNASGFPGFYRYELGDESTPDTWQRVGVTANSYLQSGAAMIDTSRGLFVRTALTGNFYKNDLAVWDLASNNAANPNANKDFGVNLVDADGVAFNMSFAASIDYDSANDQYVIWDSRNRGSVWVTRPEYLSPGVLDPIWTVEVLASSTAEQPVGSHGDGVLGKWEYIEELGAFITMDRYNFDSKDSEIWLYKPLAAVPEADTWALLTGGLVFIGWLNRRRRKAAPH